MTEMRGERAMKITKEAGLGEGCAVNREDLAAINRLTRKELKAEEVYTFSVHLCDNEVDRDHERFSSETLEELAKLFVGKSGIFDHQWSARGQTARIFRTEIVREEGIITAAGDPYCFLKGYAYMLRTEGNRELIAEIEGGIKKEVSIGCAVNRAVCSVCGKDVRAEGCSHVKGGEYGGKQCFHQLEGATDAYEWSFVAVPAQKNAGVMKQKQWREGERSTELKHLLAREPEALKALEHLEKEAEAGRRYLSGLKDEVARLGGMAQPELKAETLKGIVKKLEEDELLAMKSAYERQLEKKMPVKTQFTYGAESREKNESDNAFLI